MLRFGPAGCAFRQLLRTSRFARSQHGFGACFHDPDALTEELVELFSRFWASAPERFEGMIAYLMAIDHGEVDQLHALHAQMRAPVMLIWGEVIDDHH